MNITEALTKDADRFVAMVELQRKLEILEARTKRQCGNCQYHMTDRCPREKSRRVKMTDSVCTCFLPEADVHAAKQEFDSLIANNALEPDA